MKLVVIGASLGGYTAISRILADLPDHFSLPILIVQHIGAVKENSLAESLSWHSRLPVEEGEPLTPILPGHVYISPPEYHMLIERDFTISLSLDEKVNYSRPSIDVLFESASCSFPGEVIGILLTGANSDGAQGMKAIGESGGITIVESPERAVCPFMPASAIRLREPDHIIPLESIADVLCTITGDVYEPHTEHTYS